MKVTIYLIIAIILYLITCISYHGGYMALAVSSLIAAFFMAIKGVLETYKEVEP